MPNQIQIPADIAEIHPNTFLLAIEVEVMTPAIQPGCVVAVDPNAQPRRDGTEIGIVEIAGQLYICRPMQAMGQVVMHFDLPGARSITLPATMAKVVGAVVWISDPGVVRVAG